MAETIRVEVAYAEPEQQFLGSVELPAGATVCMAIEASGLRAAFPAVEIAADRLGIWNRPAGPDTRLRDGDRVEIYRPLKIDPKDIRRRRARAAR